MKCLTKKSKSIKIQNLHKSLKDMLNHFYIIIQLHLFSLFHIYYIIYLWKNVVMEKNYVGII